MAPIGSAFCGRPVYQNPMTAEGGFGRGRGNLAKLDFDLVRHNNQPLGTYTKKWYSAIIRVLAYERRLR